MYDYKEKIQAFISENFSPSNADNSNMRLTTNAFLCFLWNAFPENCISDYDLVYILENLGYKETLYVVEKPVEKGTKKNKVIEVQKSLELGWCIKAPFNLNTEVLKQGFNDEED